MINLFDYKYIILTFYKNTDVLLHVHFYTVFLHLDKELTFSTEQTNYQSLQVFALLR